MAKSSARGAVVQDQDFRLAHQAPGRWSAAGAGRRRGCCPPAATGASSPPGFSSTKSRAWAVSRACHKLRRRWRLGLPQRQVLPDGARKNSWARWGTTPTPLAQLGQGRTPARPGRPPARRPGWRRKSGESSSPRRILPLPVPPMMPTVSAGLYGKAPGRRGRPPPAPW